VDAGEGKKTEYQPISLQGKVVSQEKEVLDKQGEVKTVKVYFLQTEDQSRIALPNHANCKGEPKVDLEQFAGQAVDVAARGFQKLGKNGKMLVHVHEIVSVRPVRPDNATSAFPAVET